MPTSTACSTAAPARSSKRSTRVRARCSKASTAAPRESRTNFETSTAVAARRPRPAPRAAGRRARRPRQERRRHDQPPGRAVGGGARRQCPRPARHARHADRRHHGGDGGHQRPRPHRSAGHGRAPGDAPTPELQTVLGDTSQQLASIESTLTEQVSTLRDALAAAAHDTGQSHTAARRPGEDAARRLHLRAARHRRDGAAVRRADARRSPASTRSSPRPTS